MTNIIAVFLLILTIHFHGLLKAQLRTIITFVVIWALALSLALITAQGITLPIIEPFNNAFEKISQVLQFKNKIE